MVHTAYVGRDPQVETHCTKPTVQYNWIRLMILRNLFT